MPRRSCLAPFWEETLGSAGAYNRWGRVRGKREMKPDLKLFAIAIFLTAIPVLMALPQSFLVSDVVLSQDTPSSKQAPAEEGRTPLFATITALPHTPLDI